MKAATTNNEIQFAETNDRSIAAVLFPDVYGKSFLGLVKREPEMFENFGELTVHQASFFFFFFYLCICLF